jgi:hypothetical protein
MRGDLVIVRAYRGKPFVMKVWEVGKRVIYLAKEEQFLYLLSNDSRAVGPIGFPKEDVFKFDPTIAKVIDRFSEEKVFDWERLTPLNYENENPDRR